MMLPRKYSINQQTGFTLLEVLVSLVIISIGLLGLAGLQATGLKNNLSASHRSQATQLSYDIADRMRSNKASINNYLTSFMAPTVAGKQNGCLTAAGCSSSQMAQHDLYEWNLSLINLLPSGEGVISLAAGNYTVMVNWDDNRDGTVDENDPNFQMSFQP